MKYKKMLLAAALLLAACSANPSEIKLNDDRSAFDLTQQQADALLQPALPEFFDNADAYETLKRLTMEDGSNLGMKYETDESGQIIEFQIVALPDTNGKINDASIMAYDLAEAILAKMLDVEDPRAVLSDAALGSTAAAGCTVSYHINPADATFIEITAGE